jgi:hypothetical protein
LCSNRRRAIVIHLADLTGLPQDLHEALQTAQRQADSYIVRSAKLAAVGGVDYAPPAGMMVQLPPMRKVGVQQFISAYTTLVPCRRSVSQCSAKFKAYAWLQMDVGALQQQLQQVTAQRSQLAAHAAQLQSAMQQLHNSPPLLNGGAGIAASGASGSPADSLQTYSGGVSKPSKPPAGEFATCVYISCISHAVLDQAGLQV